MSKSPAEPVPNHTLEYITWRDHQQHVGWISFEDLELGLPLIHSVGWVVAETKAAVVLSPHIAFLDPGDPEPNEIDTIGTMEIAKVCIVDRVEFEIK